MEVNQFSRFWLFFSHSTTATDDVLNVFYFLLFKTKEQSAKEQKSIQDSGSRGEGRSGAPGAQSWWDSLNIWTYRLIIWSNSSVFWRHSASVFFFLLSSVSYEASPCTHLLRSHALGLRPGQWWRTRRRPMDGAGARTTPQTSERLREERPRSRQEQKAKRRASIATSEGGLALRCPHSPLGVSLFVF